MSQKKEQVPELIIELCETGESGFYLDGTAGTPFAQQRRSPEMKWIPTQGKEAYKDENGILRFREIRHIKGCETIYPEEQDKRGIKPNRFEDKIPMEGGFARILREGDTIGTYDFLEKATFYADNPFRPDTATKIYKRVKVREQAEDYVNEDELLTVAKSKVYSLRTNVGGEKTKYKYDESKIDTYCRLLDIVEEYPETRIVALLSKASANPKQFLDIIVKAENTVLTEVSHALKLNVIVFDGNTAQFAEGQKVITVVGNTKMNNDKKIEALASFLQTQEGAGSLTEMRARTEVKQNEQFNK